MEWKEQSIGYLYTLSVTISNIYVTLNTKNMTFLPVLLVVA
jgi:hypothetical protein